MPMEIRLVRIDDRLIHGQVATVWAKVTKVNRILVVSDDVAKDILRKTLLKQASPPGVIVNVITIDKMISIFNDPKFNDFKSMLLFTSPRDARRVVEGGVKLDTINIGGMSFSDGKKMITNAVAVNSEDIKDLKYLNEQEIKLEIRKVVADNKVYMMDLLKKEKMI